jgi:GT2 family glycosyltransferase
MPGATVCVSLVTFNSERYIERCLDAVFRQAGVEAQIVVVDNASTDNTPNILARYRSRLRLIRNQSNLGFADGQNQAIRSSKSRWVLALNPDVLLSPNFLGQLLQAAEADPSVGTACGKLLSIAPGFAPLSQPRIDSAGIYFTPAMRHFDRGWGEPDDGRYEHPAYVFGASGAAALYRRSMIDSISVDGDFFDPDFFVYREDADVAWRAQLLGWRCLYTPSAVGHHVRTVTPVNRNSISPVFNMHSVKNRFLMRIKNLTPGVWGRCWAPMVARDLVVLGGCILREPRSLAAFWRVARCWRRAWRKRDWIMSRRTAPEKELANWFQFQPAAQETNGLSGRRLSRSAS